jgi:hypothetical protein
MCFRRKWIYNFLTSCHDCQVASLQLRSQDLVTWFANGWRSSLTATITSELSVLADNKYRFKWIDIYTTWESGRPLLRLNNSPSMSAPWSDSCRFAHLSRLLLSGLSQFTPCFLLDLFLLNVGFICFTYLLVWSSLNFQRVMIMAKIIFLCMHT